MRQSLVWPQATRYAAKFTELPIQACSDGFPRKQDLVRCAQGVRNFVAYATKFSTYWGGLNSHKFHGLLGSAVKASPTVSPPRADARSAKEFFLE